MMAFKTHDEMRVVMDSTAMQGSCVLHHDRDLYQGIRSMVRPRIGREAVHWHASLIASMIAALLAHQHHLQTPPPGALRTNTPLHSRRLAQQLAVACQAIAQAFDRQGAAAKRRWQQLAAWRTPTGESSIGVVAPRSWIRSAAGTANPPPKGQPTAAI
jgi:hypothetical protein